MKLLALILGIVAGIVTVLLFILWLYVPKTSIYIAAIVFFVASCIIFTYFSGNVYYPIVACLTILALCIYHGYSYCKKNKLRDKEIKKEGYY